MALALAFVFGAMSPTAARAQTFTVVYNFGATATDGTGPAGQLVLDGSGNLYGATVNGGTGPCAGGCGTIFKIDATGQETVLYDFTRGTDGATPYGGVIRDADGNLYGTTEFGGSSKNCAGVGGCGTVFKLDTNGNLTTLHAFNAGADGWGPETGLVSLDGELYGTTSAGGDATQPHAGNGVIFKVSKTGKYHVLYRFSASNLASDPQRLVSDTAGNLYGATYFSGSQQGNGVLFKLDTAGTLTLLYSFPGGHAGGHPIGRIIRDTNGNIHGTTWAGGDLNCPPGSSYGCGGVFRVDGAGTETVLHRFGTATNDARFPDAGVVDAGGVLYGTTIQGGNLSACAAGCGAVFRIAGDGSYTVLYRFTGLADGSGPGELALDTVGNLYGAAFFGGQFGGGVVFKITP